MKSGLEVGDRKLIFSAVLALKYWKQEWKSLLLIGET